MVSRPLIAQGYSLAEEVANSISHGIGGVWDCRFSVITGAGGGYQRQCHGHYQLQPVWREYDPAVSGVDAVSRHSASAGKDMAQKFDHCAIYLLIAGTYTPFLLVGLNSPLSRGLMIVIWPGAAGDPL